MSSLKKAMNFTLKNANGKEVTLSDYKGKKIILYFYPKDNTSACTQEACDFSSAYREIENLNAVVIGISKDSVKSHENFVRKFNLPFELLSDENLDVIKQYEVYKLKKMFNNEYMGVERTTFIIDEDFNIVKKYEKVKVKNHIDEVLKFLKKGE